MSRHEVFQRRGSEDARDKRPMSLTMRGFSLAALVIAAALASVPRHGEANDKLAVAIVPQGDSVAYDTAKDLTEPGNIYAVSNTDEFFQTLLDLKRKGKTIGRLFVLGHGDPQNPNISFSSRSSLFPRDVDLRAMRELMADQEKALKRKEAAGEDTTLLRKWIAEEKPKLQRLESVADVMAKDADALLVNCGAAGTPDGEKFVKDLGDVLMGKNGGTIIPSKTNVGAGYRTSLLDSVRGLIRWFQRRETMTFGWSFVQGDWVGYRIAPRPDKKEGTRRSMLFLIDTSGSMAGAKLESAKRAAEATVRGRAGQGEEWALLSFSEHNVYEQQGFTAEPDPIVGAVGGLGASGDTPLAWAVAQAVIYTLLNANTPTGQVVLLSDGQETCNERSKGGRKRSVESLNGVLSNLKLSRGPRAGRLLAAAGHPVFPFMAQPGLPFAPYALAPAIGPRALGGPVGQSFVEDALVDLEKTYLGSPRRMAISVVGFDIKPGSEDEQQLRAIAGAGSGSYFPAERAEELVKALGQAAEAVPSDKDEMRLRDGTVLKGRFVAGDEQKIVFRTDQGVREVPRGDAAAIVFEPKKEAVSSDPFGPAPPELERGDELWRKGDIRGALAEYDRALQRAPGHYRSLIARGYARLFVNDPKGAREDYTVALIANPTDGALRSGRAFVTLVAGDTKTSLAEIEDILRTRPDDPAALLVPGQIAMWTHCCPK